MESTSETGLSFVCRIQMVWRRIDQRQNGSHLRGRGSRRHAPVRPLTVPMVVALGAPNHIGVWKSRPGLAGKPSRRFCMPSDTPLAARCLRFSLSDFKPSSQFPDRAEYDPRRSGVSRPAAKIPAGCLADRVGLHRKMKIGLAWSGNPDHKNDHNRSISLDALSGLLEVEATFFSLQRIRDLRIRRSCLNAATSSISPTVFRISSRPEP